MSATAETGMKAAQERARVWLEPIPGPAPGGISARTDPAYEAVAQEVAKLESPSGGAVDWRSVVDGAGALLQSRSKDLLLAAYLAHALHVTEGAQGLAAGMALLAGLAERYWDVLFPEKKRLRGRVGAIQWFVERSAGAVSGTAARGLPAAEAEWLQAGARNLAEVTRKRLGDATPGFGPLLEALERARLSAANEPARPATAGPDVGSGSSSGSGSGSGSDADVAAGGVAKREGSAPAVNGLPTELAPGADATEFLRGIGEALVQAGATLRSADASDAVAYRVLRTGLWMHLAAPPPDQGGRTSVPPPPAALLEKLDALCGNQRWAELLDEAESALPRYRFALDLQRHVFQALDGLGRGHERARDAVLNELRALLGRMPRLPELSFADGRPLASPATRAWIEDVAVPRPLGPRFGLPATGSAASACNSRRAGACPPPPANDAASRRAGACPPPQAQDANSRRAGACPPPQAYDGDGELAGLVHEQADSGVHGEANGEAQARFDESCRRLAGGDLSALAELQQDVLRLPDGRSRFVARLEVARACASAGLVPLALAGYEGLERESSEHRLDVWEPALAAECLRGLLAAARASGEDPRCAMPHIGEQFRRLCRLDPEGAHDVWP